MIVVPVAVALIATLVLSGTIAGHRPTRRAPASIPTSEQRRRPVARPVWRTRRCHGVEPAAVAEWCDELSRALRHGSTLRSVIEATVPDDHAVAHHTTLLRHRLGRGASVRDACDQWSCGLEQTSTPGTDTLQTLAAVLSTSASMGGNAAEPIDRFGVSMRQRASDQLERSANSAQARMSARVLTIVPLALLAVLIATDGDVRDAVTSTTGLVVVAIGLSLNAVGAWWMRRIAGSPEPGPPRSARHEASPPEVSQ